MIFTQICTAPSPVSFNQTYSESISKSVQAMNEVTIIVEPEYTDEQFESDMAKPSKVLDALVEKARKALKDGTGRKFP